MFVHITCKRPVVTYNKWHVINVFNKSFIKVYFYIQNS